MNFASGEVNVELIANRTGGPLDIVGGLSRPDTVLDATTTIRSRGNLYKKGGDARLADHRWKSRVGPGARRVRQLGQSALAKRPGSRDFSSASSRSALCSGSRSSAYAQPNVRSGSTEPSVRTPPGGSGMGCGMVEQGGPGRAPLQGRQDPDRGLGQIDASRSPESLVF